MRNKLYNVLAKPKHNIYYLLFFLYSLNGLLNYIIYLLNIQENGVENQTPASSAGVLNILFYYVQNYSEIASTGQPAAQAPQSMHLSASITY